MFFTTISRFHFSVAPGRNDRANLFYFDERFDCPSSKQQQLRLGTAGVHDQRSIAQRRRWPERFRGFDAFM